ncbi:Demethylmenaquinone methyltransferase [Planctomycetes bacterium Pan216]|uniref:Demethylmenaquinone methyltransferase n=1 Tax=Kolteria novifilia TaxID=2527975 RepID=A0A518B6L7_9BACT|nr:Demethylmenaquinone methyltransferase [Planctomycetes bacterium Pan216]
MSTEKFESTSEGWDAIAQKFAKVADVLTAPYAVETLDALKVTSGERLLDLACGTGPLSFAAAKQGADVMAVDWSADMIAYLVNQAETNGLDNISAKVMDGQALELPDESFDVACSVFGVFLFPDFRKGLAEMVRVVKPGGRVGVTVWGDFEQIGHMRLWKEAILDLYPDAPDLPKPDGWKAMHDADGLERELQTAGLTSISIRPLSLTWTVPSPTWFSQNIGSCPLYDSYFEALGPDARDRTRERLFAQLEERHGESSFELTSQALVGMGKKG